MQNIFLKEQIIFSHEKSLQKIFCEKMWFSLEAYATELFHV